MLVLTAAMLFAGCGGSSNAPTRSPDTVELLDGTSPQNMSSGRVADYRPTGRLIADSGFRPARDGFGFENYGTETGVLDLSPAYVEELFGPAVCASGTGATCRLTPPAREWVEAENDAMAAGHCFGMAVAAAEFFARHARPERFGAPVPRHLRITHNAALQRTIALYNSLQELPSVRAKAVAHTPNDTLDFIIRDLRDGGPLPVLGIFRAGGAGGRRRRTRR